jgi:mannose-6-phosphate isomerase-like protein (cupin superfamily)
LKPFLALAAALALNTAAQAQPPAGPPPAPRPPAVADPTAAPAAAVAALVAQAKAQRKEGQPLLSLLLAQAPGYTARVDYRASVGPANLHEAENEIFYVLEGAATLVTGGTLVEPTPARNGNRNGARVDGGQSREVKAGDVLFIAAGTPHSFSTVDRLVVLSIHTAPAPGPAG